MGVETALGAGVFCVAIRGPPASPQAMIQGAVKIKERGALCNNRSRYCDSSPTESMRLDVESEALSGSQNIISHPNIYSLS